MLIGARGCVYKVRNHDEGGVGFYMLNPDLGNGRGEYPILITGVTTQKHDNVGPFVGLENFKVLYTFGRGFGNVRISGLVFLGAVGTLGASQSLHQLIRYFESHRISRSKQSISVSLGTQRIAERVFLNRLIIGDVNTEFHIQPFQLHGILYER